MKVSKRKEILYVLAPILLSLSFNAHAGGSDFSRQGSRDYAFCSQNNVQSKVNMSIDFRNHHSFGYEDNINPSHPLFVGAAFKVKRPISTFNIEKLTNASDVATLSESRLSQIKKWSSRLEFVSSKSVGFRTLVCQNRVDNYSWNSFIAHESFSGITDVLESEGCFKYQRPSVVTVQKVFNCNSYFKETTLVTFYSEARDGGTNILSLSLNDLLNRPNGLMKSLMKNEIVKSLNKLPKVIERLK